MTKNFCDLCGNPALNSMPEMNVYFPNLAWSGSKFMPGSISPTDGTWTPKITARMIFDVTDSKTIRTHSPDLCSNCIAGLLQEIAGRLIQPPPTP